MPVEEFSDNGLSILERCLISIDKQIVLLWMMFVKKHQLRDVAQLGSAPALGAGCRRFKSCHPDMSQSYSKIKGY